MLLTPLKDIIMFINKTKSPLGLSPNSNLVFGFAIDDDAIPMPYPADPYEKHIIPLFFK